MTEKYTPEKVAELVAEARKAYADDRMAHWIAEGGLEELADALTAVSAERDSFKHQAEHFAMRGNIAEADRDRLHKAITDIQDWMNNPGSVSWPALGRILRAALDKEEERDMSDILPDSTVEGFTLYELWEIDEPFLIYATTDLSSVKLAPGTRIISRRWAPISAPEQINSAQRQSSEGNET